MEESAKKHKLINLESISGELLEVFNSTYPGGESDYFPCLVKYPKKDGTSFYALTLETSDTIYLVRVPVQTDDVEDVAKWLEGEEEAEVEQVAGTTPDGTNDGGTLPDDNISEYGGSDDDSQGD